MDHEVTVHLSFRLEVHKNVDSVPRVTVKFKTIQGLICSNFARD
jgi:hypothetical protein